MQEKNYLVNQFEAAPESVNVPSKIVETVENSQKEKKQHPDYDLIANKFLIGKAVTSEKYGSTNVYQSAVNLYAALYNPEEIDQLANYNEKYPDRISTLTQQLSVGPANIPSKEEFIETVRHAIVNEVEFGECLSAEARIQLKMVMEKSEHTVIWTDGDGEGFSEYGLPGSKEQLKKIAAAQFYNKTRREIAQKKDLLHTDVLSVVAIEGKMKFIPKIIERFLEKEIKKIIIIEDRAKNLIEASELINQIAPEMKIFPVWVRVGGWKDKIEEGMNLDTCIKELHAIGDISQLTGILENNNVFERGVKIGSIIDLDGPLHDDDIRKRLQAAAVIKTLIKNNWI